MRVHKGIVAEITKRKTAIVFTYDGDIKEVELNGIPYKPGDEIVFYEHMVKKERKHSRVIRYVSALAAGLLVFFSLPLSLMDLAGNKKTSSINTAYAATVYVESKSNVKIGVNKANQVIGVVPLNRPAQIVLKGKDWRGEQIGTFMEKYFTTAKQTGYLGPEDKAIVAVDPVNESDKKTTMKTIQKDLSQNPFIKENDIQVLTVTVPDVVVAKAEILGVTPGKFSIYLAANASGEKMPLDVVKAVSVTDLVNAVPVVAKVLPCFSENKLAQLVQNVSMPKTEVAIASTTAQNTTPNKNAKPSESADSTKPQSKPEIRAADKSTIQNSSDTKAGNDESKQVVAKQPDQKQPDSQQPQQQSKQPEQKQPDQQPEQSKQKQPEQKQPDQSKQKQPEQKQPEQKNQPQNNQPKDGQSKNQPQSNTSPSGQQPKAPDNKQPQDNKPKLVTPLLALLTKINVQEHLFSWYNRNR